VADIVAGRAFVTPTECGQELVQRAGAWWESVVALADRVAGRATEVLEGAEQRDVAARARLGQATRHQLHRHAERLDVRARRVAAQARGQLDVAAVSLEQRSARLAPCAHGALTHHAERLDSWRRLLSAYNVDRQLERGYTLTMGQDGRIIRAVADVEVGSVLTTRFADGRAVSEVQGIERTAADVVDGEEQA
jgi:exodeoxyribonuclease VII large subunit